MLEIKDVFSAAPKSNWEFMIETGQCFYIPAYQRHYSWADEHVKRLIEDTAHGLSQLVDQKESIKFLGTIIAIHDTQYVTINPIVRDQVPGKVMTIIDGQQRLSTILLINSVLHDEIRIKADKFRRKTEPHEVWLYEKAIDTVSDLELTLEADMNRGDCRYYPRLIRAFVDTWSRRKGQAQYVSPVSNYLHSYGEYFRDNNSVYKHIIPELADVDKEHHEHIVSMQKLIRSQLRNGVAKLRNRDQIDLPTFDAIANSPQLQEALFNAEFLDVIKDFVRGLDNDVTDNFSELLRLICFANYFMKRVCVTIVTAKSEDYAFDMFEALNTTGEPLTAFETFKPSVIKTETLTGYRDSPSHQYVDQIDDYLKRFTSTNDRQNATSDILIPFALAETGKKLSKRLNEQRRYMRETYERLNGNQEEQRAFVRHLSVTSNFVKNAWDYKKGEKPKFPEASAVETDDIKLCIDYLKQAKHNIVISPLVRFYTEILLSTGDERRIAEDEFIEAVRAIAAFFTIWRGSRSNTGGVDTVYRDIMANSIEEGSISPLCRSPKEGEKVKPKAEELRKAFRYYLADEKKGNIQSKDDWIRMASQNPAFKTRQVARFILLAAFNDVVVDADHPGLVKKARRGRLNTFTFDIWKSDTTATLEHIAPQSRDDGWGADLYETQGLIDRLGNLTLLPLPENASLGNRPWEEKKHMYQLLSSDSEDDQNSFIEEAARGGLTLSDATINTIRQAAYLPYVEALGKVNEDWKPEHIEQRSQRIAELAWDQLSPWLGLEE